MSAHAPRTTVIEYHYRGSVERWSARLQSYVWHEAYSEQSRLGGIVYPWLTRSECIESARRQGARAKFWTDGKEE